MDIEKFTEKALDIGSSSFAKSTLTQMSSRLYSENKPFNFVAVKDEHISKITENMKEIDRANNALGKSRTMTERTFFTLSEQTPLKNMVQAMANIESKRSAIKTNEFKLKNNLIKLAKQKKKLDKLNKKIEEVKDEQDKLDSLELKRAKLQLKITKIESDIADSRIYLEGAIKELYHFQEIYNQIKDSYNLDEWDEKKLEEAEYEYHIKRAFEQAYQNFVYSRSVGGGEVEYFRQMGIDPQQALLEVVNHYNEITQELQSKVQNNDDTRLSMKNHYDWLDRMYNKYKDSFNDVLERNGIKDALCLDIAYVQRLADKTDKK